MDTIRTKALGQSHAVVDDEGDAGVGADALEGLGEPRQLMLVNVLYSQLESGRDPLLARGLQAIREAAADVPRADQIELGRLLPLRRRKVDGIELGFVHFRRGPSKSMPDRFRRSRCRACGRTPRRSAGRGGQTGARG